MTSIKEVVGRNIKFYLDQHNMSQAELYRRIGSNSASVNEWVKGRKMPEAESLEKIAAVFCVPVSELFVDRYGLDNRDEKIAALSYYDFLKTHPDARFIADLMMGCSDDEIKFLYLTAKNMKTYMHGIESRHFNK